MCSNITEAEWKVMKVLWENSPLTLKEIASSLKKELIKEMKRDTAF